MNSKKIAKCRVINFREYDSLYENIDTYNSLIYERKYRYFEY